MEIYNMRRTVARCGSGAEPEIDVATLTGVISLR